MKEWYSFKKDGPYPGDAPPFFDLKGQPWFDKITGQLPVIQQDVLAFMNKGAVHAHEYFNVDMVQGQKWEAIGFIFWGLRDEKNIAAASQVMKHFEHIPALISCSVSILSPHTHIKAHYGDTDAIYRLHIPISIPAMLPDCGFKVAGNERSWDQPFAFCDAHLHEAWNNTANPRLIMILDVVRPEYLHRKEAICLNILSSLDIQSLYLKRPFTKKLPWYVKGAIRYAYMWRRMLKKK